MKQNKIKADIHFYVAFTCQILFSIPMAVCAFFNCFIIDLPVTLVAYKVLPMPIEDINGKRYFEGKLQFRRKNPLAYLVVFIGMIIGIPLGWPAYLFHWIMSATEALLRLDEGAYESKLSGMTVGLNSKNMKLRQLVMARKCFLGKSVKGLIKNEIIPVIAAFKALKDNRKNEPAPSQESELNEPISTQ